MIFTTITMNPCLDRREYLERFEIGKTNRPYKTTEVAGGKGINVSRELVSMLDVFKASVRTVTFAGGATGERLKALLEQELGVREAVTGLTVLPSRYDTRICTKIVTPFGVTEINEEGRLSEEELSALAEVIADIVASDSPQVVFLCGSFPQGVDINVENSLITLLEGCGISVIVDTSGKALVESLVASPSLIKPNESELSELHGAPFQSDDELVEFCQSLYVDNRTEVLCTLGEKGALFVGEEGVFRTFSQRIPHCDPTGAGDAFLAAFCYARYADGKSAKESLDFAGDYVRDKLLKTVK
ncbi:MAG: bifunctional hydroxymethylpyrimidine kinase/phosphomethylpyrimidine kinase [Clostridia bacterium]|nr:bifunctional hydroxymethylpyrimidine kinase/phosphomethylpyrimidine kinase [Clostridia bacterium]